jgi:hypothetical protein
MSDIRSRWVLTRGLTASGGSPRAINVCWLMGRNLVAQVHALGMHSSVDGKLVLQYAMRKFNPIASTGPA